MKKLLTILFIFCLSLSIALPVFARVAGQVILPERTTAPPATTNTNKIYNLSNVAIIVDENGNRYIIAGAGVTEFESGISASGVSTRQLWIQTETDNVAGVTIQTLAPNGDIWIDFVNPNGYWRIESKGSDGGDLFFYKDGTEAFELTNNSGEVPGTWTVLGNIIGYEDVLIVPTATAAAELDVTTSGAFHSTVQTIFKVDLAAYTGKTLTFSSAVAGTTIWFVDAVSAGKYGGASGVCIYNNVDTDFIYGIYFPSAASGFPVAQNGSATYEVP